MSALIRFFGWFLVLMFCERCLRNLLTCLPCVSDYAKSPSLITRIAIIQSEMNSSRANCMNSSLTLSMILAIFMTGPSVASGTETVASGSCLVSPSDLHWFSFNCFGKGKGEEERKGGLGEPWMNVGCLHNNKIIRK